MVHVVPLYLYSVLRSPTIQPSIGLTIWTALSGAPVGEGISVHCVPFQCQMLAVELLVAPTAQASVWLTTLTLSRETAPQLSWQTDGGGTTAQLAPFHCSSVPPTPTAHPYVASYMSTS